MLGTSSSLILQLFKYPGPTVIWFWNFSNTQAKRFFLFWNFSNTQTQRFFDLEAFQIPRCHGSLILKLFKYPGPTVLWFGSFSNTQVPRFFDLRNLSTNWNLWVLKDEIPAHTGLYQDWVGIWCALGGYWYQPVLAAWDVYIYSPGIKLVLSQVPTKHVLVQGGYCLMSTSLVSPLMPRYVPIYVPGLVPGTWSRSK
jgi:hypothetical protein